MNPEIKNGMFTSTQVSTLLGLNVQTLREWQRKNYLQLPDTGGWQRYSIPDILTLSAMDHVLNTGVTHETAASIARFSFPILAARMKTDLDEFPVFYLLVSMNPNEEPSFDLIETLDKVSDVLITQSAQLKSFVTRILIDFKDVFENTFESLKEHTVHDGPRMFWKSESDPGK